MSGGGGGGQDAAAMDALNLDDLFLGGDDDDQGGMADSLFADMDLDLGDIMDGVIGDVGGGSGGGGTGGGGGDGGVDDIGGGLDFNFMDDEFGISSSGGSVGGTSSVVRRPPSRSPGITASTTSEDGGGAMAAAAASKGKGKVRRTARSNPHLAAAQAPATASSSQSKSISNEAKMLASSLGSTQTLSSGREKRKRRKSKRAIEDDDEYAPPGDSTASSGGATDSDLKKSSRINRSGGSSSRSRGDNRVSSSIPPSGASSSILPQSTTSSLSEAKLLNPSQDIQAPPFSSSSLQSSNLQLLSQQYPTSPTTTLTTSSAQALAALAASQQQEKAIVQSKRLQLKKAQTEVKNYGLPKSRTLFFPYMSSLPQEVDVKKRGQKMYPVLEKVNLQSAPGVVEKGEKDGKEDSSKQPPSPSSAAGAVSSSSNPNSTITTDSAIYTLFDQNIGALTDNHGVPHPPATLVAALKSSTETVGTYLKKLKKKQNKRYQIQMPTSSSATSKEPQSQLSPSSQSSSSTTSSALVEELSKLYLGCMKQSAFLRQNLWNMEEYCASNLSKEDIKSTFPIKRKDVEAIYRKMQMHKMQTLREKRMERIREHQRKERQKRKIVASDKNALPTPLERSVVLQSTTLPENNNLQAKKKKIPTHGGPNSTPIITLKVKVKVSGWRDKSGARLTARLWCPTQWKVALKCAKNLILLQSGVSPNEELVKPPMGGVPVGPLDLSGVEEGTMEAVARELVRFDLVPNKKKKEKVVAVAAAAASAAAAAAAVTSSGGMVEGANKAGETIEKLKPPSTMSLAVVASGGSDADVKKGDAVADTKEVKKTTKKRKAKDQSSDSASSTTSSSATSSSTSVVLGKKNAKLRKIIPYVQRYDRPRFHPAILAPAAASSTAKSSLKKEDSNIFVQEQNRLFHHFYNQILNTNLSPTERRTLLANELSSTLARLENHRKSSPSYKKMHEIQTQLEELQTIYLEDVDIVPDKGGCTIGMWNWLKRNNYFENDDDDDDNGAEMTTEEDVYEGLEGIWQPELNNHIVMEEDDREEERKGIVVGCGDWGSVSESKKVVVKSEEGGAKRSMQKEDDTPSPLFDRLQSLLVEEDEGSDEDDDDDDDLIANLPPYSPEEFIHGPKNGRASVISSDEDDGPDDAMLDVSALTLDQRTFIQLRAAGLVDASTPFNDAPPPPQPSTLKSTKTPVANEEDDEPIDAILTKMKSHLSTLHAQNNTNVAILQRKALSHVLSPTTKQHRTKRGMTKQEDVITLARYKQLQKVQKAQQEENQRQIRTSTRVKTGSNKFDGEQWLPW